MKRQKIIDIERNLPLANYYNLSERLQKAYNEILDALLSMQKKKRVVLENAEELLEVYEALYWDYPEAERIWNYEASGYELSDKMELKFCYRGSRDEIRRRLTRIEKKVEEIILASLRERELSDDKIIEAVYAYMCEHYRYSDKLPNGKYPEDSYTLECLLRGDGVCAGIALSLTYILRKLQIPVICVMGTVDSENQGRHMWNLVQLSDGRYCHLDLTWDMGQKPEYMQYLKLDDTAMGEKSHNWKHLSYPVCTGLL